MGYYTFPHTRTYDSDLGWLICHTKKLLKMYDKWDQLPDMIKEILEEYIKTGEINDIIEGIIGDFVLNPKYPPSPDIPKASGDGSTDDTASIQGCIDYAAAHGKLGVYFPTGAYLTGSLALKDGVSLFGSDRYTTKLVLKSGATAPLLSGNVSNMGIHRLTLDSNAGNQVNNIKTVTITAGTDIEFNDVIFASGFVNLTYLGTSGHLQLSNIIFANAVLKHLVIAGSVDVQAENIMFENLSSVSGNCCMDVSSNSGYYQFSSNATTPVCIRCAGSDNRFEGFIHNAVENVVDTGERNNIEIVGISVKEYLSGNKDSSVGGDSSENVIKNKQSTIGGTYTQTVTGSNTEISHGNKIVNVDGNIQEGSANKIETTGNKTVSATGSITENAADIILNSTNPLTYKTPAKKANYNTIPFKDTTSNYNVLVENEKTENAFNSLNRWGNIPKGRVLIIGDSFAGNWQGYAEGSWSQRFIKKLGNPDNNIFSYGGAGFIAGDNVNHKNYQQNFDDYIKPEISDFVDEITLVIIQGGLNDYQQNYGDEISAVENLLNDVMNYIPNASIYGLTNLGLSKLFADTMLGINRAFENCGIGNTTYGNGLMLGQEDLFNEDKLHPNEKGHDYIANKLYSILVNNGDDNLASFGSFTSNGGGGLITRTLDGFIYLIGSGNDNTPSESNSIVFPNKIPTYFCPEGFNSFTGYTDAGVAYFSINGSNGELSVMIPTATNLPNGIGNWRFRVANSYFDK